MTLEQLRIFAAVAEREHVTQAARELNLTQSAVSAAVAALEGRYATKLFDRIGRRIVLTHAGGLFLVEARAVLARAAAAETVLADLSGLKRGTLAIAASQTIANYWLPPLARRYRELFPGIELRIKAATTPEVVELVCGGGADLGFVEAPVEEPTLSIAPLAEDELVVVSSEPFGLISRAQLKDLRWILREQGSATRAIFEGVLAKFGIATSDLDVVLELPSNEAVRTAVENGAGAAVLSRLVVADALRSGSLVALDIELPKRRFFSLRHKERYMTRAVHAFCQMLEGC
jgi:DNA-binding transcriptional LysR family regulator